MKNFTNFKNKFLNESKVIDNFVNIVPTTAKGNLFHINRLGYIKENQITFKFLSELFTESVSFSNDVNIKKFSDNFRDIVMENYNHFTLGLIIENIESRPNLFNKENILNVFERNIGLNSTEISTSVFEGELSTYKNQYKDLLVIESRLISENAMKMKSINTDKFSIYTPISFVENVNEGEVVRIMNELFLISENGVKNTNIPSDNFYKLSENAVGVEMNLDENIVYVSTALGRIVLENGVIKKEGEDFKLEVVEEQDLVEKYAYEVNNKIIDESELIKVDKIISIKENYNDYKTLVDFKVIKNNLTNETALIYNGKGGIVGSILESNRTFKTSQSFNTILEAVTFIKNKIGVDVSFAYESEIKNDADKDIEIKDAVDNIDDEIKKLKGQQKDVQESIKTAKTPILEEEFIKMDIEINEELINLERRKTHILEGNLFNVGFSKIELDDFDIEIEGNKVYVVLDNDNDEHNDSVDQQKLNDTKCKWNQEQNGYKITVKSNNDIKNVLKVLGASKKEIKYVTEKLNESNKTIKRNNIDYFYIEGVYKDGSEFHETVETSYLSDAKDHQDSVKKELKSSKLFVVLNNGDEIETKNAIFNESLNEEFDDFSNEEPLNRKYTNKVGLKEIAKKYKNTPKLFAVQNSEWGGSFKSYNIYKGAIYDNKIFNIKSAKKVRIGSISNKDNFYVTEITSEKTRKIYNLDENLNEDVYVIKYKGSNIDNLTTQDYPYTNTNDEKIKYSAMIKVSKKGYLTFDDIPSAKETIQFFIDDINNDERLKDDDKKEILKTVSKLNIVKESLNIIESYKEGVVITYNDMKDEDGDNFTPTIKYRSSSKDFQANFPTHSEYSTSLKDLMDEMKGLGAKVKKENQKVNESAKSGDKDAYKKFYDETLKKYGVDNISSLDDDKKKEFFDEIEKGWIADDEDDDVSETLELTNNNNIFKGSKTSDGIIKIGDIVAVFIHQNIGRVIDIDVKGGEYQLDTDGWLDEKNVELYSKKNHFLYNISNSKKMEYESILGYKIPNKIFKLYKNNSQKSIGVLNKEFFNSMSKSNKKIVLNDICKRFKISEKDAKKEFSYNNSNHIIDMVTVYLRDDVLKIYNQYLSDGTIFETSSNSLLSQFLKETDETPSDEINDDSDDDEDDETEKNKNDVSIKESFDLLLESVEEGKEPFNFLLDPTRNIKETDIEDNTDKEEEEE